MFNTPILLLVFNRPSHTQQVFDRIKAIKPSKLFVGADGPRSTHPEDIKKCKETRDLILNGIDWPCEIKTFFRDNNRGCGRAPAEAIGWFFDHVEEGIILEDDCLPEMFFFQFCAVLLNYYRNEKTIMHISGNNFQNGQKRGTASYYFSAYNHNWGWATWKRCWSKFKYSMDDFDRDQLTMNLKNYKFNKLERQYWISMFEKLSKAIPDDIWDYQWGYTIWKNGGLCILPNVNLVKNIGFGEDATHTKYIPVNWREITQKISEEIYHPSAIVINNHADHYTFTNHFHRSDPLWRSIKNKLLLNPFIRWVYNHIKSE